MKRGAVKARGLLFAGLLSLGCAEILGLDTPQPRPTPDKGGSGGSATGGSSGTESGGEAGTPGGEGGTGAQSGSGGQGGTVMGGAGGGGAGMAGAGMGGSPDCTEGDVRCGGETTKTPEICDESGNWIVNEGENGGDACPVACDAGKCIECEGGKLQCSDKELQRCEDGAWVREMSCPHYCRNEACDSPPSCMGLGDCSGSTSCCSAREVPGGSFIRDYDGVINMDDRFHATVSTFLLDEFEVTVGRFRNFVRAYPNLLLMKEDGKALHIDEDEGWLPEKYTLPPTPEALELEVTCEGTTWTANTPLLPMNCVNWYIAYAFCIWDGGRLPTEAEWNRAAAGGDEQRVYPWSDPPDTDVITPDYAVYGLTDLLPPPVGSKQPLGAGKWGHADLAGSLYEWTLDYYTDPYGSTQCNDCLAATGSYGERSIRGGSYDHAQGYADASSRAALPEDVERNYVGFRCARDIELP